MEFTFRSKVDGDEVVILCDTYDEASYIMFHELPEGHEYYGTEPYDPNVYEYVGCEPE